MQKVKSILLPIIFLFQCSLPYSTSSTIIGKWRMGQVFDNKKDVTAQHNPEDDRYIIFKGDSTFESGGQPYGKNTGKWSFTPQGELFLDSDSGEDDDSYWLVNFAADSMIWQGQRFDFAKRFKITHVKAN